MMKIRRLFPWLLAVLAVVVIILFSYEKLKVEAPVSVIEQCRRNISAAKSRGIARYEPGLIRQADSLYLVIMQEWGYQNEKPGISRNFEKIIQWADSANLLINTAIHQAMQQAQYLDQISTQKLNSSRLALQTFKNEFGRYPFAEMIYSGVANCELKFHSAGQAYARKNFVESIVLLDEMDDNLDSLRTMVQQELSDYFSHYDQWKKQEAELIQMSRKKHSRVLIVDKIAHVCSLYHQGDLVKKYNVELGKNWIGDKNHQGDKATPEGLYQVVRKLQKSETRFYKALLLNYPNAEDQNRYRQNLSNGHIPQNTPIGGLIEIHGEGDKGIDWTDGCIALQNQDMDEIFASAEVGMQVLIIGSSQELSEIHQMN